VDADGTQQGFELTLTRLIATQARIPVVASGGAGTPDHLAAVFTTGCADAAIIAGMIHTGAYTIRQIKEALLAKHIPVRMKW
jgi:cyclase